ncbi:MAG TPA: hypothetical protein VF397_05525 [Pyrinomonadaceae bacterium]
MIEINRDYPGSMLSCMIVSTKVALQMSLAVPAVDTIKTAASFSNESANYGFVYKSFYSTRDIEANIGRHPR